MAAINISSIQRYALDRDDDLWLLVATTASIAATGGYIRAADLGASNILAVLGAVEATGPDATELDAVAASGTIQLSDAQSASETVTIDGIVYTFLASPSNPYEVDIGGSAAVSAANLDKAINRTGTPGTEYGVGTMQHPSVSSSNTTDTNTITARVAGSQGNSIDIAGDGDVVVSGANLTGGEQTRSFASVTATFTDTGADTETVTIDSIVYTLNATPSGANSVDVGAAAADTASNLAAAINRSGAPGATTYTAATVAHPTVSASVSGAVVTITARLPGSDGDGIAISTDSGDITLSNSVLSGGAATGAKASGTVTFNDAGTADETITVAGVVYTQKAAPSAAFEVDIGGDAATSAANLAKAINRTGTPGTEYGADTPAHSLVSASVNGAVVTVTARQVGTGGNSLGLAASDTATSITLSGSTLAGGYAEDVSVTQTAGGPVALPNTQTDSTTEDDAGDIFVKHGSSTSQAIRVAVLANRS